MLNKSLLRRHDLELARFKSNKTESSEEWKDNQLVVGSSPTAAATLSGSKSSKFGRLFLFEPPIETNPVFRGQYLKPGDRCTWVPNLIELLNEMVPCFGGFGSGMRQ